MAYFQYVIEVSDQEKKEIAIAMLNDLGCEGFEENEESLVAISKKEIDEKSLEEVMQVLDTTYLLSEIEEKNWNEKWESEFHPIRVVLPGSDEIFAYVRAHFHPALRGVRHDLIITPKMSFGTGHHATTYGMMALMSGIDFKGAMVVDFGTGTGLLAILAEKLGAQKILALDNDPWCIRNAEENVAVNSCHNISLKESDHFEVDDLPDVILANINLNIIKSNLQLISNACKKETVLLFSGILESDENEITQSLNNCNISTTSIIKNNGWLIIAAKKEK